jgi:hypothetical protein
MTQHAAWLYLHFALSFGDLEDLLSKCRLDISFEGIVAFRILTAKTSCIATRQGACDLRQQRFPAMVV